MSEEGAVFQSYLDGRTILLSPEVSIETQKAIGSDIMMVLDQCIPSTADEATARQWRQRGLTCRLLSRASTSAWELRVKCHAPKSKARIARHFVV